MREVGARSLTSCQRKGMDTPIMNMKDGMIISHGHKAIPFQMFELVREPLKPGVF